MSEYKALIFDFDGTIVDSEAYKLAAFKSLFTDYPEHLDEIERYNSRERGVNRRIKFEYILKSILVVPYTDATIEELADRYGARLRERILELPLIGGVKAFLGSTSLPRFVASSGERAEIELVTKHHDIWRYFAGVSAHPVSKKEAIEHVLTKLKLQPEQALFFGDARADYEAARATGADFMAVNGNAAIFPDGTRRITDFHELRKPV